MRKYYKHFKGGKYTGFGKLSPLPEGVAANKFHWAGTAEHTETGKKFIVFSEATSLDASTRFYYNPEEVGTHEELYLYIGLGSSKGWARPYDDFFGMHESGVKRFNEVTDPKVLKEEFEVRAH